MALIRNLPADQLPTSIKWTFANVAARDAQEVTSADVGRFGYVADDPSLHLLVAISPTVWMALYEGQGLP
jgi:hypothetical protein